MRRFTLTGFLFLLWVGVLNVACVSSRAWAIFNDITPYQMVYKERSGQAIIIQSDAKDSPITLWDGNGQPPDKTWGSWITLKITDPINIKRLPLYILVQGEHPWQYWLNPHLPAYVEKTAVLGAEGGHLESLGSRIFPGYFVYKIVQDRDIKDVPTLAFRRSVQDGVFKKTYVLDQAAWHDLEYRVSVFQVAVLIVLVMISLCLGFVLVFGTHRRTCVAALLFSATTFVWFVDQWHMLSFGGAVWHGFVWALWVGCVGVYGFQVFAIPSLFVPVSTFLGAVFASFLNAQLTTWLNPFLNDMLTYGLIAIAVCIAFFAVLYQQYNERIIPFFFSRQRRPRMPEHGQAQNVEEEDNELPIETEADGLWVYDVSAQRVHCSKEVYLALKGTPQVGDLTKDEWEGLVVPDDKVMVTTSLRACLEAKSPLFTLHFRCLGPSDQVIWFRLEAGVILDLDQNPIQIQGILLDITSRKETQIKLIHEHMYDIITGLPGRSLFLDRLSYRLLAPHVDLAVMVIGFEMDPLLMMQLGAAGENQLAVLMMQRIQKMLPSQSVVARLTEGSSFAVFMLDVAQNKETFLKQLNKLLGALSEPVLIQETAVTIQPAIGLTFLEGESMSQQPMHHAEALLKEAELACFLAQRPRFDDVVVFEPALRHEPALRWNVAQEVEKGLIQGRFTLAYHPIFEVAQRQKPALLSVELQWEHPRRGTLMARDFLPNLQEGGALTSLLALSRFVFQEMRGCAANLSVPFMIELLTPAWMNEPHYHEFLDLVQENKPGRLLIPESFILRNPERSRQFVKNLKENCPFLGLSLGRFTGACLGFLAHMPFDAVHLDARMVVELSAGRKQVLAPLVGVLHALGKKVALDQVAHADRFNMLSQAGCDWASGLYLSAPMSYEELVETLGLLVS